MLRRALAALLAPAVVIALLSLALAADDIGGRARKLVTELAAERAAPALSGAPPRARLEAIDVPLAEARRLLARAEELRHLGDVERAEIAEDAALEWAETARDTLAAIALEGSAGKDELAIPLATGKADKARAALDEAIARRGKLQAELDALDAELAAQALEAGDGGAKVKVKKAKGALP